VTTPVAGLSGAECSSRWLLRLASASTFSAPPGRSETDGADQTVLAGVRLRLWLLQDPSGPAGQRAIGGVNRVWRLMKRVGIKAQVRYRSLRACKGEAIFVLRNRLQRQFNPDAPDERWVTDITYIRTHKSWLYLAVVVNLFLDKIIG